MTPLQVAQEIARQIEQKAGPKCVAMERYDLDDTVEIHWLYDCPCGEVSGYGARLDPKRAIEAKSVNDYIHWQVDFALAAMRTHVRSEGNEPSF